MTPFRKHLATWANGCGSSICEGARKCFSRGTVPCDILFIGEAPGHSENSLGKPFVGPAGHLLDYIVSDSIGKLHLCTICGCLIQSSVDFSVKSPMPLHSPLPKNRHPGPKLSYHCPSCNTTDPQYHRPFRTLFTNLVLCIPLDSDGHKTTEPSDEEISACSPRLQEFISLSNPRLIICVGALARDWLDPRYKHHIPAISSTTGDPIIRSSIDHPASILRANIAQKGLLVQKATVLLRTAAEEVFSYDPAAPL